MNDLMASPRNSFISLKDQDQVSFRLRSTGMLLVMVLLRLTSPGWLLCFDGLSARHRWRLFCGARLRKVSSDERACNL